jgi:bacterioferritin-associated ferredoxin
MTDATGRLPVWERLRAPDRRRLTILPLRRIELPLALIHDGDLIDVDATVFDIWRRGSGFEIRAARIEDASAVPYLVLADGIESTASDGRLEALLGERVPVSAAGELERLACACRGISADAVYRSMHAGWRTVEQLKRSTRVTFGVCQGRRCVPWLADRLELPLADRRAAITARPPLVPVPASLLAAFAAD